MGDWTIQALIPELLAGLILMVAIPMAIAIYGWLRSIQLTYVLTIFMVCFAAGLTMFEKVNWKKPALTPEKIEDRLRNLAYKARFSIKDGLKEADRFRFVLKMDKTKETAAEIITIINRKEDSQSHILIATAVKTKASSQKLFGRMNDEEKLQFTSNIKIELLKYGVGYSGVECPFKKITLIDEFVYAESLTLVEFVSKLKPIRRAKALLDVLLSTKILEIKQAQEAISSSDSPLP